MNLTAKQTASLREDILLAVVPLACDGGYASTIHAIVSPRYPKELSEEDIANLCRQMLAEKLLDSRPSTFDPLDRLYLLAPRGRAALKEKNLL